MTIRAEIERARLRRAALPGLGGDPAWEVLLDLADGGKMKTSCVGGSLGVAQTTALRYIRRLEDKGMVERSDDPDDGRYTLVCLTDAGRAAVERCIA